jgi:tRNA pseudouridine13 synthase
MSLPAWARAYPSVSLDGRSMLLDATIRTTPEEFDVTEELGYEFDGEGEHDYLRVEKTGANTEWVGRQLAQFAEVPAKDVGYSGLKDRHAVTRQWFSVPRWNAPVWDKLEIEGVSIIDVQRHSKKLRRGVHKANRFRIVLRGPTTGSEPFIDERLQRISEEGVPNYFGPQRFGRNGANMDLANAWSSGKRLPRHKRSIAISSARSFLFNEHLHSRVEDGTWNQILSGDVANLDGTGSVFDVEAVDETLIDRCREMDIHPTGVLWGDGCAEDTAPAGHDDWLRALSKARVKPLHRSLRLRAMDLQWQISEGALTLTFGLGRGAYATSVLHELAEVTNAQS